MVAMVALGQLNDYLSTDEVTMSDMVKSNCVFLSWNPMDWMWYNALWDTEGT